MAASSLSEAVELYRAAAARTVSCLTRAHVEVGGGYARPEVSHAFVMGGGDAVALRGDGDLTLSVGEEYRIVEARNGGWRVRTMAYFYAIGQQRAGELLAYHWHPRGRGTVAEPHLHVNTDARSNFGWMRKVHLRTGPIRLQDVILLAIEELNAAPIREDWRTVLDEARRSWQD